MKKSKIIICLISALLISVSSAVVPNTQVAAQALSYQWEYHNSYQTYASRDTVGVDVALKLDKYNNDTAWHEGKIVYTFYNSENEVLGGQTYIANISKKYSLSRRFYPINDWKKLVIEYYVDDTLIDTRTLVTK